MNSRVFLNASDAVLAGKYPGNADTVLVVIDSALAAFTVTLPDLFSDEHKEFIFFNLPSSGSGNTITLACKAGQPLMTAATTYSLAVDGTVTLISDFKSKWLIP